MSKDTYEIEVEDYINFNCTSKGVEMEMHAGKVEGLAICGAACVAVLESYFRLMDEYGIPLEVGMKPLLPALEEEFKAHDANVTITHEKS